MTPLKLSVFGVLLALGLNTGCNDSKSRPNVNINGPIVGAWELESIQGIPGFTGVEKADPAKPFENKDSDFGGLQQLEITETHFYMIDSDGIHVSKFGLEYKVENNVIVTIDTENTEMTDYPIVSATDTQLILRLDFETSTEMAEAAEGEESASTSDKIQALAVYKKIANEKLATKTAKSVTFESKFSISANIDGREQPVTHEFQRVGEADFTKDGHVENLACEYDSRNGAVELTLTNSNITHNEDDTMTIEPGSPFITLAFPADLQGLGDGEHDLGEVAAGLTGSFYDLPDAGELGGGLLFRGDEEACAIQLDLKGAEMVLRADCSGSYNDRAYSATIDSQCLIKTFGTYGDR